MTFNAFAGQLFGHMHKDDFRLQLLDSSDIKKSFALIAPSLSPDFNSNPAFRVMSLDKEALSLVDYNQYYMDLDPGNMLSSMTNSANLEIGLNFPSSLFQAFGCSGASKRKRMNSRAFNSVKMRKQ